jgi:hypothetical protein
MMTVHVNNMMTVDVVMTVALKIVVMIMDTEIIVIAVMVITVMLEDTKVAAMVVDTKATVMVEDIKVAVMVVGVLVVSLLHMLTLLVKSVTFMDILLRSAGGATVMTVATMVIVIVVETRGQILRHKELIQTGTMKQGPLITSQAS